MNKVIYKAFRGAALLVSIAILALSANVAFAKNIKKQNLLELMNHTDSILVGTVTKKTDGFHKGLPFTEITIKVGQSVKGDHGENYTFRQFGLIEPKSMGDGRVNLMVTPAGWPTYTKGEQVMLFLHKAASETGFQTTAGLTQGKFTVRGDRVANGIDNDALFAGLHVNSKLTPTQEDLVNQAGGAYAAEDLGFAAEFVRHFRVFAPRLAKGTDYGRRAPMVRAVSALSRRDDVDRATLGSAVDECARFAEHLDRALERLQGSPGASFDKEHAASELRDYLSAARNRFSSGPAPAGAFGFGRVEEAEAS